MSKILILDNHIEKKFWGAEALREALTFVPNVSVVVRRAPQRDLPQDISEYDAVVASGSLTSCLDDSSWVQEELDLIRKCLNLKKPFLGVCFGHQLLARVLGGKKILMPSPTPEFGWTEFERVEKSLLFDELPQRFYSYSSHREEVAELPGGTQLLVQSKCCQIQAFRVLGHCAFGIQFHPEKKPTQDLKNSHHYSPLVSRVIFSNFFNQMKGG